MGVYHGVGWIAFLVLLNDNLVGLERPLALDGFVFSNG